MGRDINGGCYDKRLRLNRPRAEKSFLVIAFYYGGTFILKIRGLPLYLQKMKLSHLLFCFISTEAINLFY